MNIADKATMFDQTARVLRPTGRLALFDIIAGEGSPDYPMPWADDVSISHLVDETELRFLLSQANFKVSIWEDVTEAGAAFFSNLVAAPLGPHLIIPNISVKMGNLRKALENKSVRVIRAVCHLE